MKKLVAAICCLTATLSFAGQELVPPSPLSIDFGASVLSGTGRMIRVTNVPVVNNNVLTYYNAEFEFQFLADGRLAAVLNNADTASGPALSPTSSTTNFNPGVYKEVSQGCLYTLSAAGIGANGSRTFNMSINVRSCFVNTGGTLGTTFSFSTAPVATNPFITTGSDRTKTYPNIDGSFGLADANNGRNVRALAVGSTVLFTPYEMFSGQPFGSPLTFIRQ